MLRLLCPKTDERDEVDTDADESDDLDEADKEVESDEAPVGTLSVSC